MQEVDHLIKMANQIADNFSFHDDAVERVADHLQRFWAPSMRKKLKDQLAHGSAELKPAAAQAVQRLDTE